MKVTVKFYASLREELGIPSVAVDAENADEAIKILLNKFGDKFKNKIFDSSGKIKAYYIFLLNGFVVDKHNLMKTKLKEGDIFHIFPPIAGG